MLGMSDPRAIAHAAFADAVGLWRTSGAVADVVDASTDLLVAGEDTPSLRELAGTSRTESVWVVEPLLTATVAELGLSSLMQGSPERATLIALLHRFLEGRVTLRDLTSWAHTYIGHGGEEELQPFVLLDDELDGWAAEGEDLGFLEAPVRLAVQTFLDGGGAEGLHNITPPMA